MKIFFNKSLICKFCFVATILIICKSISWSQEIDNNLDELINEGNFEEAIQTSKALLANQPDNPVLNFKLGYCYLNTTLKKGLSITYLNKAVELYKSTSSQNNLALEAKFYLGKAYHKNYKFVKALEIFQELKTEMNNKEIQSAIDEEIEQCNNGLTYIKAPSKIHVTNLGKTINSTYSDHSPVLSADESVLIFTSRRKTDENTNVKPDGQYNEDIYISNFDGKSWSEPKSISPSINTNANEASIGLSVDGQQLLIYRDDDAGTILVSNLIGVEWSAPRSLGNNINTRYRETHATISADNQYLYFTSDRPGGYGGLDIYQSKKQKDDTWGKAVNLGPTINTAKDEEGPFIHPDGVTLYFSSEGHETMGGFDIFISKKNEFGTWGKPENMGYPVNTTEDDVFFNTTPDGKRVYVSSYREEGFGGTDLYMLGLPDVEENPITIVKGIVGVCKSDIQMVQILVYEQNKTDIIGLYKPNSATGKYLFVLSRGKNYQAVFQIEGKIIHTEDFYISNNADYQVLYRTIKLKSENPCNDFVGIDNEEINDISAVNMNRIELADKTIVDNILFKINNAEISYFAENIKRLADYIKKNPTTKIEIFGYADTQGPEAYNLKLSTKRAFNIYEALIKQGVNKEQISYRGEGERNQLTINNYDDGSYVWQSLPYNRRVEFIVHSDTSKQLIIKQVNVPKLYLLNQSNIDTSYVQEYENKFTIQIGAFSKPIGNEYFKNLSNLQLFYNGKYYHYTYGEYSSVEIAAEEIKKIYAFGYKDAFIRKLGYYFPDKLK